MRPTPEDQAMVLATVIRALQVFVRVAQDPECKSTLDPDSEILADWTKTMAQMQRQAEQGIKTLEAQPQTRKTKRQIALLRQLLDEVRLLGSDSPMEIQ